jgi:glycosyltransferase involved in cell wall biosynthesis
LHDYKLICPSYLLLAHGNVCQKCKGRRFYHCLSTRCHRGELTASLVYTFESYFNKLFKKYDSIRYIICPSRFLLDRHRDAGIPESRLVHLPNFIKVRDFEPDHSPGQYVLFVGRLSREKGVLTLLEAVKDLDVPVRIVGGGPMKDMYEDFAKQNGIHNVTFEGYQSGEALRDLYRNAAFLVFPSEWFENAPMTILEAFAYGKSVIGSAMGGIPEMVVEGETGILFRPGDHLELRDKIQSLLADSSAAIRMGKLARSRVEREYEAGTHYERLVRLYETTMNP